MNCNNGETVGSDVPRDDLATLQGLPKELFDVFVRDVGTDLFLHVHLPAEDFLIGQTVECVRHVWKN